MHHKGTDCCLYYYQICIISYKWCRYYNHEMNSAIQIPWVIKSDTQYKLIPAIHCNSIKIKKYTFILYFHVPLNILLSPHLRCCCKMSIWIHPCYTYNTEMKHTCGTSTSSSNHYHKITRWLQQNNKHYFLLLNHKHKWKHMSKIHL
jgi:hypothetical protein